MMRANYLIEELKSFSSFEHLQSIKTFFKTDPGQYSEHDIFIGTPTRFIRQIAKKHYRNIEYKEIEKLLNSPFHEVRFLGLLILVYLYDLDDKSHIFSLYMANIHSVNNWDLVDYTAPNIVGKHLYSYKSKRQILFDLSISSDLWHKRISIVSTLYFVKKNEFEPSLEISKKLLNDDHDLIHKAIGWVLREIFKKDPNITEEYLIQNYSNLPRTTLRYAIEKMEEVKRLRFLKGEFSFSN